MIVDGLNTVGGAICGRGWDWGFIDQDEAEVDRSNFSLWEKKNIYTLTESGGGHGIGILIIPNQWDMN